MRASKDDVREIASRRGWTILRRCPVCAHERWRPLLLAHRDACLAQCNDCEIVFLNPRPSRDETDSGYEPDDSEAMLPRLIRRGVLNEDGSPNPDTLRRRYDKLIELTAALEPTEPVVDIGCGMGTSTLALHAADIDAIGLEIDPNFVEVARSTFGLDVRVADVTQPLDRRHPVATLNSVLEHIDDPVRFLSGIRTNVLEDGGTLVVTVPNLASTEFVRLGTEWPNLTPQHVFYFTEATLAAVAERAGFTVDAVWAPEVSPRPDNQLELWARIGLGHAGNLSGGIGMALRAG